MKIPRTGVLFRSIVFGVAAAGAAAGVISNRPPAVPPSVAQIQDLLPTGSVLHSLARLEMNGRPPQEVALVVGVPAFPGAGTYTYYGFIFASDPWRRRVVRTYAEPLPGPLPLSVDAGRLLGDRDAAVFGGLERHGTRFYRVVGWWNNKVRVVHEGRLSGNILVGDGLLIEDGIPRRVLVWDGHRHRVSQRTPQVYLTVTRASTWRYSVRNGKVGAHTSTVDLVPRQVLHVTRAGGGPTTAVVPDARLDLVEGGGYRARAPGIYTIRIVTPFVPVDQSYTLTVVIGTPAAP